MGSIANVRHRQIHLINPGGLLMRRVVNLMYQLVNLIHMADDRLHGDARRF